MLCLLHMHYICCTCSPVSLPFCNFHVRIGTSVKPKCTFQLSEILWQKRLSVVVTVHRQYKHEVEVGNRFMFKLCSSCAPFKVFPVYASWFDRATDSCNNSSWVFHPILPMVCIFHSPGTFANTLNHRYSISSKTRGFDGIYHTEIYQFLWWKL